MDFQCFVINKQKIDDFPLSRIGNMDETPMCFQMIYQEMLQKSFLKCCIRNNLDSTKDDDVWQEDSNKTESEDNDEAAESGNEDQDEKMWNDDKVKDTLEDCKYLFGRSGDKGNGEDEFEVF